MIFKHHPPSSRTIIMIYEKASKGSRSPVWMKEVLKTCNIKRNHKRGGRRDRLFWRNVRGVGSLQKGKAQVELVRDVIKRLEERWICC